MVQAIDNFVRQMDSLIKGGDPVEQKITALAQLVEENTELLRKFKNVSVADKFEKLPGRILNLKTDGLDPTLLRKIETVSKNIKAFATRFITDDEILQFVQKFGQEMTFIDIRTEHRLFEEQIGSLITLLPNLKKLIARRCVLDSACIKRIAEIGLPHVEEMEFKHNVITAEGCKALAFSDKFPKLRKLGLSGNYRALMVEPFTSPEFKLRNLQELSFYLGDADAQKLAQSTVLPNLRKLHAEGSNMKDTGEIALVTSNTLKLEKLYLCPRAGRTRAIWDRKAETLELIIKEEKHKS